MRDKSRYRYISFAPRLSLHQKYQRTPLLPPCPNPYLPPNNTPRLLPRITLPPNIIIIPHQRLFRMRHLLSWATENAKAAT